jgi:hypothetical protein
LNITYMSMSVLLLSWYMILFWDYKIQKIRHQNMYTPEMKRWYTFIIILCDKRS